MLYVFYSQPQNYNFSFEEWDKSISKNESKVQESNTNIKKKDNHSRKDKLKRQYKIRKYIRPHILKRDNYKCVKCGSSENITIHHKIEISQGGNDSEENLITLCYKCHALEHKNEQIYNAMKTKL